MTDAFKNRSWRYLAALQACPTARFAELVPIAALKKHDRVLIDLMGGNGFVSDHIGNHFESTFLIDKCSSIFPKHKTDKRTDIQADAAYLDFQEMGLPLADTMVCLAGFHHLPEDPVKSSPDVINDFRTRVLKRWREGLRVGGRLIIADVAAADTYAPMAQFDDKLIEISSSVMALHGVGTTSTENCTEPAEFLNSFVNEESAGGHDCQFESAASIKLKLESAGFSNVDARVYYTPWVFADKIAAVGFVSKLFGIGENPAVSMEGVLFPIGLKTLEAIEKYLGMNILPDGRCVVHWKLLYAWGERCDG